MRLPQCTEHILVVDLGLGEKWTGMCRHEGELASQERVESSKGIAESRIQPEDLALKKNKTS